MQLVRHAEDGIFQGAGEGFIVDLNPLAEDGSAGDGFVAEITLGVDPNATPEPAGMGPAGGPSGEDLPSTGGPGLTRVEG